MNGEQITAILHEHWYFVTLVAGVVVLIGAVRNWNWLCDPTGKPDTLGRDRGTRRLNFFLLGLVLIAISIYSIE